MLFRNEMECVKRTCASKLSILFVLIEIVLIEKTQLIIYKWKIFISFIYLIIKKVIYYIIITKK